MQLRGVKKEQGGLNLIISDNNKTTYDLDKSYNIKLNSDSDINDTDSNNSFDQNTPTNLLTESVNTENRTSVSEQFTSTESNNVSKKKNENVQKQSSKKTNSDTQPKSTKNESDETVLKPVKLIPRMQYDFIPQYARNYLYYMINVELKSEKTVYEYYLDLRTFFRFIVQLKNITDEDDFDMVDASNCPASVLENITLTELYAYLNYIREDRDNNARSRMRKTSSLKSFYRFLCKHAIITENPTTYLEAPKQPKNLPIHLTVDDSIKLLESIDGPYKERNFAIITLFLNCGLRLSELVGINLSDIKENTVRVLGKGNKERMLYLNQACVDAISEYLKVRPNIENKDRNALFISRQGNRISRRMVQTLVENYIKQSGLDPKVYSTHKLRHTAATLMYQNGVDIRVLQQLLGHSNLGTTQIYTHIVEKQVEDAIKMNPLNNKKIKRKETSEE